MKRNVTHSRRGALLALSLTLLSAATSRAVVYSNDGGVPAASLGDDTAGWSAAAINHFTVVAGGQNITSVSVMFGANPTAPPDNLAGGEPFTVAVWSDPNGDGNPNDAVLLGSAAGVITFFNDNVTFQSTPIVPLGLSVGQSFFAGVYYESYPANVLPQAVSGSGGFPAEAWLAYNPAGTLNLSSLGTSPVLGNFGATVGNPSIVPMVRANGVPEPGAMSLTGLAALGLLGRRRQR